MYDVRDDIANLKPGTPPPVPLISQASLKNRQILGWFERSFRVVVLLSLFERELLFFASELPYEHSFLGVRYRWSHNRLITATRFGSFGNNNNLFATVIYQSSVRETNASTTRNVSISSLGLLPFGILKMTLIWYTIKDDIYLTSIWFNIYLIHQHPGLIEVREQRQLTGCPYSPDR